MAIDRNSNIPIYRQLQLILQDQILFGELSAGVLLPTEQELCDQYKISRITVRNALANLEHSGLIYRIQGRGSIVKKRDVKLSFGEVHGFTYLSQIQGYTTSSKILKKELVQGNSDLLSYFQDNTSQNDFFWHFCSLRYLNDEPAVIMNHYVKKTLGDKMQEYDLEKCSLYYIYEEITHRKVINKGSMMAPVQATPEIAKILNVETGTSLMWSRGITYLEGDIPVEVTYSLFVGSKFLFELGNFRPRKYDPSITPHNNEVLDFSL